MAKTITLKFTMTDGTEQEVSFSVPSEAGVASVSAEHGISGDGSPDSPLKLFLTSGDGSVTISEMNDDSIDLKVDRGLTRDTISGNFSFGYPDSPKKATACGKFGNGIYFKTTTTLYKATAGDTNVIPTIRLSAEPCDSAGTPVPYSIEVELVTAASNSTPSVIIWLILPTAPTHKIDRESKTITQLTRSSFSDTSGLPDYPTADVAAELTYTCAYYHK